MIILQESISEQQISFIPREMTAYSLTITNETTEVESILTPDFFKNDYYYTCTTIFPLKENHFYELKVKNTEGTVIYLDEIFCTNQNTDDYDINKDRYTVADPTNTTLYE